MYTTYIGTYVSNNKKFSKFGYILIISYSEASLLIQYIRKSSSKGTFAWDIVPQWFASHTTTI